MALGFNDLTLATQLVIKSGGVPNIVGEAGIGKTALVTQLAHKEHAKLFTTVVSLMQKGDLALPIPPLTDKSFVKIGQYGQLADVQFGYNHTLIQILKETVTKPETPIYWFLDEFNRGSQDVQSELMNLVLQRKINDLSLPSQVHIIMAENPDDTMTGFDTSDYGVSSSDDAIKDRTVRLVMKPDINDWLTWAKTFNSSLNRTNIHPRVVRYLEEQPADLYAPNVSDDIFPTPRAWQRVSNCLYQLELLDYSQINQIQLEVFAGSIGAQTATKFIQFMSQIEAGLVAKELLTMPIDLLLKRFKAMNEPQKLATLKATFALQPTIDDNLANRMIKLLTLMNPDNQYALLVSIANDSQLLDNLYQLAQRTEFGKQFYLKLEQISLLGW